LNSVLAASKQQSIINKSSHSSQTLGITNILSKATLPNIAQTVYALHVDNTKAFEAGYNDHTGKPIKRKEPDSLLTKYLQG